MAGRNNHDDDLAYGEYHDRGGGDGAGDGQRGLFGDLGRRFLGGTRPQSGQQGPNVAQQQQPQLYNQQQQQYEHLDYDQPTGSSSSGAMSSLFNKLHGTVHQLGKELQGRLVGAADIHSHTHSQDICSDGLHTVHPHRYNSFAPERQGNDIKWYVDGCGYMWAVSRALESARESIWILDWWLSPELYLRRPPAANEQYRIDKMLQAAAQRGVKVNIIVYKEVTQALTLSSSHTKHALEDLHPNICVFRHPDHLPDRQNITSSFLSSLQNLSLTPSKAASLPGDALKAIYGMNEDTVLYWAHHEKLCLIDGRTAFMGGLDLCYGRWDTNQHSISDVHPGDLNQIVFPGQDYNNARIMDFQDVVNWQNNKLDRTQSARMGWSDISLCLTGPAVEDLKAHFVQRWNFIYDEKYDVRKDTRYSRLSVLISQSDVGGEGYNYEGQQLSDPPPQGYLQQPSSGYTQAGAQQPQGQSFSPPSGQAARGFEGEGERGFNYGEEGDRGLFTSGKPGGMRDKIKQRIAEGVQKVEGRYAGRHGEYCIQRPLDPNRGISIQLARSCAKWSHGGPLEHSIANAYIEVIRNSQHFVYIENQFFITATTDEQKPIKNKIGAAMVERIIRAARNREDYKMIIVIPSVPAFAGDLRSDDALATRAIMEFQYFSISRGGHSIYETIAREGINPTDYIRFYNLRNYDRINVSSAMTQVEQASGVSYEDARIHHDAMYGVYAQPGQQQGQAATSSIAPVPQPQYTQSGQQYAPPVPPHPGQQGQQSYEMAGAGENRGLPSDQTYQAYQPYRPAPQPEQFQQYQQAAANLASNPLSQGRWDSIAECYMLNGTDIRSVPWEGGAGTMDEIDAFVSEELYVHSKLLIADDRIVICGSANLNDRSQLGNHDSEIAIVIEEPPNMESTFAGRQYPVSHFATSLRRQIFRKHLGLLKPQDMQRPDSNFEPMPTPNDYDWNSEEDQVVSDPLASSFTDLWNSTARTNTQAFGKVFHPVPSDEVRNWKQYDEYYERYFPAKTEKEDKNNSQTAEKGMKWGHVVKDAFPGGVQEVKEELSKIRGTLVEMPLLFLKDEDIAKEGLGLNAFTEEVYT